MTTLAPAIASAVTLLLLLLPLQLPTMPRKRYWSSQQAAMVRRLEEHQRNYHHGTPVAIAGDLAVDSSHICNW
jgi:hypothetical protein